MRQGRSAPQEHEEKLLREGVIDLAQLHGHESEETVKALQERTGKPIIKAFRIESEEDIRAAERSRADYVLLDSGIGGTGKRFDWDLARDLRRPFFLAGGLDAGNVAEAIARCAPFAVDASSSVETGGRKDPVKIEQFLRAVRRSES